MSSYIAVPYIAYLPQTGYLPPQTGYLHRRPAIYLHRRAIYHRRPAIYHRRRAIYLLNGYLPSQTGYLPSQTGYLPSPDPIYLRRRAIYHQTGYLPPCRTYLNHIFPGGTVPITQSTSSFQSHTQHHRRTAYSAGGNCPTTMLIGIRCSNSLRSRTPKQKGVALSAPLSPNRILY